MGKQEAISSAWKKISKTVLASISNLSVADLLAAVKNLQSLKPERPMKYPYTLSAKIAQFPFKFYFSNNWIWKYYPFGILVSMPVFWYISKLANSPSNKAIWKEKRRKEREEHH